MNLTKYKYNTLIFNKNFWRNLNIITDVDEFNEVVKFGESLGPHLKFTKNGHLRKEKIVHEGGNYIFKGSTNSFEYILLYNGLLYKFAFIPGREEKDEKLTGMDALKVIKEEAGDLLKPYAVKTNAEVLEIKKTITKYRIELTEFGQRWIGKTLNNVYHIDIHSAFPAGLCAIHPEFKPIYEKHYKLRKEDEIHKCILNYSIGAMQSLKIRGDRYPVLSRDAINWTNTYLDFLSIAIEAQGDLRIVGYNTDGIFVYGYRDFHNPLEGDDMGQWRIDHHYDKIRFKSKGAYEYVENGEYHAVVRGIPKKLSDTFQWGDIFKYHPKSYVLNFKTNLIDTIDVDEGALLDGEEDI